MPIKAYKATYRSPGKDMDFVFMGSDFREAKETAKQFFAAIGHLGEPGSSLRIKEIRDVEESGILATT